MSTTFHNLVVKNIKREIPEALSISFEVPSLLKEVFSFKPGQYLTLKMKIKGTEARRSYSMSSAPKGEDLTITVKRVKGGLVSNYLNDELKVGDSVEVMKPEGRFCPKLNPEKHNSYYLFAGGSGITPLMSILKTILEEEPLSEVHLLYANRNEEQIIFKEDLDKLQDRYGDQIVVEHLLSQPKKEKKKGIGGLFKKAKSSWTGKSGRLHDQMIHDFLEDHPQKGSAAEYYICGPQGFMETAKRALSGLDIDPKSIHIEYFVAAAEEGEAKPAATKAHQNATILVMMDGKEHQVNLDQGQTILEAAMKAKVETPFSCQSGACSTCMAKLESGEVTMDSCLALDDDEVASGYILTCQARPVTAEVKVNFDL